MMPWQEKGQELGVGHLGRALTRSIAVKKALSSSMMIIIIPLIEHLLYAR